GCWGGKHHTHRYTRNADGHLCRGHSWSTYWWWRAGRRKFKRSTWCQALLGPLQEGNPADGQGKRSDSRAETRHVPLPDRAGPERGAAVWADSRRSSKGESRLGRSRRPRQALHGAV